jgi:hypothetical protein
MKPEIRRDEELIVRRVGDELIIYDLHRDQGHALNQTAAFVFEQCDGKTSIEQMAIRMGVELNIPHAKQVTTLALDRLYRANLLVEKPASGSLYGVSRRDVLKLASKAGLAAAMLPVVTTMLVPSAAQAQSAIVPPPVDTCVADCMAAYDCTAVCNGSNDISSECSQCIADRNDCIAQCQN